MLITLFMEFYKYSGTFSCKVNQKPKFSMYLVYCSPIKSDINILNTNFQFFLFAFDIFFIIIIIFITFFVFCE